MGGKTFTSRFIPVNAAFNPAVAVTALQAMGAWARACCWKSSGECARAGDERLAQRVVERRRPGLATLFAAYRTGAFSEMAASRGDTAGAGAQKARDLLKAMAAHWPEERRSARSLSEITVVSTTLLTSFLGRLDHQTLAEHVEALEAYHGQTFEFEVGERGRRKRSVQHYQFQ